MKYFRIIGLIIGILFSLQSFSKSVERIVSLAPSLTKNIYYLQAQNQLVGCTSYCTEAVADGKEIVASAIKVNVEKTVSLEPDLVIVTTITSPETIDLLKNLGVKVEVFGTPKDFEEICDQFLRLGKLIGKEEKAKTIIAETTEKVNTLKQEMVTGNHPNIFFQVGVDPIFAVLSNTFMDDYIQLAGGTNIAKDLKHGTMTRESVLAKNPDYIYIVTMGLSGENEKEVWERFPQMNATKEEHIFVVDADKACSPTPITFLETFEEVVKTMKQKP